MVVLFLHDIFNVMASGLDTSLSFNQLRLSMERHEGVNINAPFW